MARDAKWFAKNYAEGDRVVLFVAGTVTGTDSADGTSPLEVDRYWPRHVNGFECLHGSSDYDTLVEACDIDLLLAAIERKVGGPPPGVCPNHPRRHVDDLKVGETLVVRRQEDGVEETVRIEAFDRGTAGEILVVAENELYHWLFHPGFGIGDRYYWPEGIDYER